MTSKQSLNVHVFCQCDEDTALCGEDLSDDTIVTDATDEEHCQECLKMEAEGPCRRCGI